jgi:UDPglucose--hexose-1-phosphate uridylyltransferase
VPELRKDPVMGGWVIIATERSRRPSDFLREQPPKPNGRVCPLCPGHENITPPEVLAFRDGGGPNQPGWRVRVIPNKFPALRVEGELNREGEGLYDKMNGVGAHEVIVESPSHDIVLGDMPEKSIEEVFWAFRERFVDLKKDKRIRYIMVYKNHGDLAGASLSHTHSQLIGLPVVPRRVSEEMEGALRHYEFHDRCVFCDIVRQESTDRRRVVLEVEHFLVVEPFAPRFPFETWIVPKTHESHFERAPTSVMRNLAGAIRASLGKMNAVLENPAYNMVIHTAPVQDDPLDHYHWHIELIPKITRFAGFEWGTGFYINPTPPEEAARYLREAKSE